MRLKSVFIFLYVFLGQIDSFGQVIEPAHIKSVQLRPVDGKSFSSIAPLGTTLQLSFDDLEADQKDYYYKIEQMTHDWKPSSLISNQYIEGFQSNLITTVENSFNTLQNYTHYEVNIPNRNTRITKSGNYLISILNEDDEVVFSRRLTLYESIATVGVQVSRSRNTMTLNQQQTVQLTVNHPTLQVNNPGQEIHIAILQNQDWNSAITNLNPSFFKRGQLIYNYTNNTNFWGGNEYLFFDTKNIRNTSLNIRKSERKDVFHTHLFPYKNQLVKNYTYNPDINGQFLIRTIEASDSRTEADYAKIHFTVQSPVISDKEVYIFGAFNNFEFTDENKMEYDSKSSSYKGELILKQGFYNYTFVTRDANHFVSQADLRGDFSKTENEYTVLVYYKPFGALYDRAVAVTSINYKGDR